MAPVCPHYSTKFGLPFPFLTVSFLGGRYCNDMKVGDWKVTISNITRSTMQDFFLWVCENYSISTWGTSKVYIRQFGQLYTTVTGRYPDRNDMKELYKVRNASYVALFYNLLTLY